QAEDGIRDYKVTGVQTCALPISREMLPTEKTEEPIRSRHAATPMFAPPTWSSGTYSYDGTGNISAIGQASDGSSNTYIYDEDSRSEERRVGKEWRCRGTE